MANGRMEVVAATILTSWTDSETAMQIVGTSLGVFGDDALDPTAVLSNETPLRDALFDILLSLVEGGAIEMQATHDGHYAFRWREDMRVAGLSPAAATMIDISAPAPRNAELEQIRTERDAALGRAELAEALAAERDRLLLLAGAAPPSEPAPAPPVVSVLDEREQSALDALYADPDAPTAVIAKSKAKAAPPKPKPARAKPAPGKKAAAARKPAARLKAPKPEPTVLAVVEELEEVNAVRQKWSGYAIDGGRGHLTSVGRRADDG